MRGSREISLVPSLHRASTDALIVAYGDSVLASIILISGLLAGGGPNSA